MDTHIIVETHKHSWSKQLLRQGLLMESVLFLNSPSSETTQK